MKGKRKDEKGRNAKMPKCTKEKDSSFVIWSCSCLSEWWNLNSHYNLNNVNFYMRMKQTFKNFDDTHYDCHCSKENYFTNKFDTFQYRKKPK